MPSRKEYWRQYKRRIKQELLDVYGAQCACCGETTFEFLTLDHIDGSGAAQRRGRGGAGGSQWYREAIRLNDPAKFRILCFNCNCGRVGGECPHEVQRVRSQ